VEYWLSVLGMPHVTGSLARAAEGEGWHGVSIAESPHQIPDTYQQLYAAAASTTSVGLATGVTHPATRLAATTASSIATIQVASGGRAVLGLGRGDSAHACLGLAPAPVAVFEKYLRRVQEYLAGKTVQDDPIDGGGVIPPLSSLNLGHGAKVNKLQWLPPDLAEVPIDVAAAGPKMIALAARMTGRVTFAVGAEPERLNWAIGIAKQAHREGGQARPLSLGAYLPLSVHPDRERALRRIRGPVASFARMSAMHPRQTISGVSVQDEGTYDAIRMNYDLSNHFGPDSGGGTHIDSISEDFAARFGVVGNAEECADKLQYLAELGLDRVILISASDLSVEAQEGRAAPDTPMLAERTRMIGLLRR
jgi:5,10-methylenetetrahydromethanopterin reductase